MMETVDLGFEMAMWRGREYRGLRVIMLASVAVAHGRPAPKPSSTA